jgi:hypothetical protein
VPADERAPQGLSDLATAPIEIEGYFTDASNHAFLVKVGEGRAVYKPRDGETPLWDFPDGTLYRREVAAYRVSEALGWGLVPETVVRVDAPLGIGSVQRFIEADPQEHYLTMMPARADDFRPLALFDLVVNNADRKSGSVLLEVSSRRIWAVDHGVCFHIEDKLRSVIWDFAGEPIAPDLLEALRGLDVPLEDLLEPDEVMAMRARTEALVAAGVFPHPPTDRRAYPWPPI